MKYRKRPIIVKAVRWTGSNFDEVKAFMYPVAPEDTGCTAIGIRTLEGLMLAAAGDWIIRGVKGELYPCKPDIFNATYEEVM